MILGPLPPTVGGITTLILGMLNSSLNITFQLLTFDTKRPTYNVFKDVWDYTLVARIGFISLISSFVWTVAHIIKFPFVLIQKNPDLVHINTASYWVFWENGLYVLLSRLFRKKVILHIHGGDFEGFYNNSNTFSKLLIRAILNSTDEIFALSFSWKKYLDNITVSKVIIIENFVVSTNLTQPKNRQPEERLNVLFVGGNGAKMKGLYDVIDAASIVIKKKQNINFILLACLGIDGLETRCRDKGIASNVSISGFLKGPDKTNAFLNSDIFLLPSYAEGFPITMLEAMAMGLPVIATPVGAIPDVIEDDRNGYLIKIGDYHTLAEKILTLAENPSLRFEIARNNLTTVAENYEKSVVLKKIQSQYAFLLGPQSA